MKHCLPVCLLASILLVNVLADDDYYYQRDYADYDDDDFGLERPNHPVCRVILDSWWSDRENEKIRDDVVPLDTLCANMTNQPNQCRNPSERDPTDPDGNIRSDDVMDASCVMVGAKSKRCIGNPCNQLNTGDCTIQQTNGQCFWLKQRDVSTVNSFLRSQGRNEFEGFGCQRNPCNIPLVTKMNEDICTTLSIPAIEIECTWCAGRYDKLLRGKGMGCQMTRDTTEAECAPVSNPDIDQASVFQRVESSDCQCSTTYPNCHVLVDQRDGQGFEHRWPPTPFPTTPTSYPTASPTEFPTVEDRAITNFPTASPTTPFPTTS